MHSCTPWNQPTQLACDCAKLFSQSMHFKYIRQFKEPFKYQYNKIVHFIRLLYLAPCDLFNIPEAFVFSPNIFFLNCLYNSFLFREYIKYIPKISVYTPPSCQASNSSKTWSSHVRDPIKIRLSNPLQGYALQILLKGKETTQLCTILGKYQFFWAWIFAIYIVGKTHRGLNSVCAIIYAFSAFLLFLICLFSIKASIDPA